MALGPHAGSIFLAHDYLTGLGTEITRRDEIRLVENCLVAFGMRKHLGIGMLNPELGESLRAEEFVYDASALPDDQIVAVGFLANESREVSIRREDQRAPLEVLDHFDRVGRSATDVRFGFDLGRGVDVGHHRRPRIPLP